MITITKMVRTCFACPSQWDGWDANGTQYYFRFRYGTLRVDNEDTRETLKSLDLSDGLDGCLDYEELRKALRGFMVLPEQDTDKSAGW